MENRIQILTEEIQQIRAQYIDEVGPGGRKAWPRAIKSRVLELDQLLPSTKQTSKLSGIPVETLYIWRSDEKKKKFRQLAVVDKKSATVTVTEPQKSVKPCENSKSVSVTVTSPEGFRVDGMPANLAIDFLLKMRSK